MYKAGTFLMISFTLFLLFNGIEYGHCNELISLNNSQFSSNEKEDIEDDNSDFLLKIIPPAPSVAAFQEYLDIPVTHFNGRANISVPVYDIVNDIMPVEISLNYSSNGVLVNQPSSVVGMGWQLSVGGMVSRNMRGRPDEEPGLGIWSFLSHHGFSSYYGETGHTNFVNSINNFQFISACNPGWNSWSAFLVGRSGPGSVIADYDLEYDEFQYNFFGYSGTFFISSDHKAYLLEDNGVRIQCDVSNDEIIGFTIFDPQGREYRFGYNSTSVESINEISLGPSLVANASYESTWHLISISLPNTNEVVEFKYTTSEISESREWRAYTQSFKETGGSVDGKKYKETRIEYKTRKLDSIIWRNGYIDFEYMFGREDMRIDNGARLSKIKIFSSLDENDQLIKEIDITNSYVTSHYSHYSFLNDQTHLKKRLFLDAISITGYKKDDSGNLVGEDPLDYYFDYYSPGDLPPARSYGIDYWGFFNGDHYENEYKQLPIVTINGYTFNSIGGSDKEPSGDIQIRQYGMLKEIHYPTGGYANFIYGKNTYFDANALVNKNAGGVRIEEINYYDNTDELVKRIKYGYSSNFQSTGYLNSLPEFYKTIKYKDDDGFILQGYLISNSPANNFLLADGNTVGYEVVEVSIESLNGEENSGKQLFYYYPPYSHPINPQIHHSSITDPLNAPSISNYKHINSGRLFKHEVYGFIEGDYQKVKEIRTAWMDDFTSNIYLPYLRGDAFTGSGNGCLNPFSFHYFLLPVNNYSVTSKTTTVEFFNNDSIKTNSDYYYNASNPFKPQLVFSYALPDSTKQQNWVYMEYLSGVNDFIHVPESLQPVYPDLVTRKRTGKIKFDGADTLINMQNGTGVYYNNSYGINRITSERHNAISDFDIQLPEYSEVEYLYDDTYNPLKVLQEDIMHGSSLDEIHEHIAYIWGYNYTLPIAKIENINYAQVVSELSNMGYSIESLQNKSDNELRIIFNSLRNQVNAGLITSFTHIPMIGISSITDPRGLTTRYEYDGFGRLKKVIDHEGKILQEHKYNYAEQE